MAIRFDSGTLLAPHETPDGVLLCEAVFAKDGVLEYRTPDGRTRRELRPPEENQRAIAEFGLASVTLEHPTGLVDGDNGDRLRKGITLQNPVYKMVPGKGGFVQGQIAILAKDAQDSVRRGDTSEVSAGYRCRIEDAPGIWRNPATGQEERYDAIQRDLQVNHVALTRKGRAGPDVRLLGRFDSEDDIAWTVFERFDTDTQPTPAPDLHRDTAPMSTNNGYTPLATLDLPGGSVTVPQDLFNTIQPLLTRKDSLESEVDTLQGRLDAAEEAAQAAAEKVTYSEGTLAAVRDRLDAAETLLDEVGIYWGGDSYYRSDAKKGKKAAPPMDMDDEDMDDMDDDEEFMEDMDDEMPPEFMAQMGKGKGKGKGKKDGYGYGKKKDMAMGGKVKKDSADIDPRVLARQLMAAHAEAQSLGVDLSDRFDSLETPADIRRAVVAELRPQSDLQEKADAYIDGIYDYLLEERGEAGDRRDSYRRDYTEELSMATANAGRGGASAARAAEESRQRRMNNYRSPLTATKQGSGR